MSGPRLSTTAVLKQVNPKPTVLEPESLGVTEPLKPESWYLCLVLPNALGPKVRVIWGWAIYFNKLSGCKFTWDDGLPNCQLSSFRVQ